MTAFGGTAAPATTGGGAGNAATGGAGSAANGDAGTAKGGGKQPTIESFFKPRKKARAA